MSSRRRNNNNKKKIKNKKRQTKNHKQGHDTKDAQKSETWTTTTLPPPPTKAPVKHANVKHETPETRDANPNDTGNSKQQQQNGPHSRTASTYTGETNNKGIPRGEGRLTFTNDTVYKGDDFRDGHPEEGQGKFICANKKEISYQGQVKKGSCGQVYNGQQYHGRGMVTRPDGKLWHGEFRHGVAVVRDESRINVHEFPTTTTCPKCINRIQMDRALTHPIFTLPDGSTTEWLEEINRMGFLCYSKKTFPDHTIYEGDFEKETPHGYGQFTYPDGTVYNGNVQHGRIDRYGSLTTPDGTVYKGQFRNGKRHGKGAMIKTNGSWCNEVVFSMDKPQGHAKWILCDGSILEHEWLSNGDRASSVTIHYPDCTTIYQGQCNANDQAHGSGVLTVADGIMHVGNFREGYLQGHGKMLNANGDLFFQGEFQNGKPHGFGTQYFPNGSMFESVWINGTNDGTNGKVIERDGALYQGTVELDITSGCLKFHKTGRRTLTDGTFYSGTWRKSLPHGKGRQVWPDGSSYEGEIRRGLAHGNGKWVRANGTVKFEGQFHHGSRVRHDASKNVKELIKG